MHASQIAGLAALVIAGVAILGWWADLPLLSRWGADLPAATPLSALCVASLGLALMLDGGSNFHRSLAFTLGLAAIWLAAADLGFTLFGLGQGAEGAEGAVALPAATALGLMLVGGGFVLSHFEGYHLAAMALAGVSAAIAAFALLGDLTGINALYDVTSIRSPPLPTVVGFLCIALGLIRRIAAKPALRRPRPLWQLLTVLGLAIVAPLLLFGAYAGARVSDAQFNQVREELMDEARTLSADVDREIVGEIETMEALAASPSLLRGDFAAFQRQAEAPLALRQSGNIMLIDRNLQQIVNTSVPFGTPMPEAAIHEAVGKTFATGKTQVTSLFEGPVAHEILFSIVVPVKISGEIRYVLARSPSQRALDRVVASNALPPGWTEVVFDAAHRVIAQSGTDSPEAMVGRKLPPSQWQDGRTSGVLAFTDAAGRPSLQAYTKSDLTGWGAAVWAPKAVLGAPLRTLWWTLGWMALLALSLVVGLALWVGRIISRSVGHAAHAAVALGEGRPLPPSGTPVAEINTLMAELEESAVKRQTAEDFLRDSEGRLQLALAAAQLGSWQHDPARRMLSGDARAQEIFDLAADIVPSEELVARVHPDDAERVAAVLWESADPVNPRRADIEFRIRRRNGEVRWLETVGLVGFEGAGEARRPVSIGTVADITERKELEEERKARAEKEHLLMREMNHRAKNMLSVVDAIAHQTATRNPEDFLKRFSERIQSLAANQDLLMRTEWKGVEITELVQTQLAHFTDLIGSRIVADGPRMRLTAASAQAIGLALHELATNAGKYGALSTKTGRVDIRWETSGSDFTMSWTESGGPAVSAPERRGFGSTVMGVMAERSVGGTVEIDYAPSGVTWRLTCPAANALEAGVAPMEAGEHDQMAGQSSFCPPPCAGEGREGGITELTMR